MTETSAATGVTASPEASIGSCYGFEVRSPLSFQYLRQPSGGTPLHLFEHDHEEPPSDEPVFEWLRRPGHPLHAKLYEDGECYWLWTDREGWFRIDPRAPSISVPTCDDHVRREERVWGIPINLCYLLRGDLGIHASSVDIGDGAVLFGAPGRFGKTTLAGTFLARGYRVLAEDFSCCRLTAEPAVLPGPAMLRVRRDVYERLEFPGTYTVAEEPDRVHLALDAGLRGDSRPVPIVGILLLRESDGECRMERLSLDQALPDLWTLTFKMPTDADLAQCFQDLVSLAAVVPVWNVHRPLTVESLPRVIDMIVTTCAR